MNGRIDTDGTRTRTRAKDEKKGARPLQKPGTPTNTTSGGKKDQHSVFEEKTKETTEVEESTEKNTEAMRLHKMTETCCPHVFSNTTRVCTRQEMSNNMLVVVGRQASETVFRKYHENCEISPAVCSGRLLNECDSGSAPTIADLILPKSAIFACLPVDVAGSLCVFLLTPRN